LHIQTHAVSIVYALCLNGVVRQSMQVASLTLLGGVNLYSDVTKLVLIGKKFLGRIYENLHYCSDARFFCDWEFVFLFMASLKKQLLLYLPNFMFCNYIRVSRVDVGFILRAWINWNIKCNILSNKVCLLRKWIRLHTQIWTQRWVKRKTIRVWRGQIKINDKFHINKFNL